MQPTKEEHRLILLLDYYNLFVSQISPIKQLRPSKSLSFKENSFFVDLRKLDCVITSFKTTPQKYLEFQFRNWRIPFKLSRKFPPLSYLSSPNAVEKFARSIAPNIENMVSSQSLISFSESYIKDLMTIHNIKTEEDFFKDPIFISDLPENYLKLNKTFQKLLSENYYENTFGITKEEIMPSYKELNVC